MLKKYDAYIVGYYGMKNSGDDALMQATVWAANHLLNCKTSNIGLYSSPLQDIATTHQVKLNFEQNFPGQNRLINYKAALQSKSIVFGGGSVLHSETDINLKRHLIKLSGSKNSRAVGVSLGPFQTVSAEEACTQFLNECSFVGVRDTKSFDIAKSLAPQANIEKTFDLAPLLLCARKRKPSSEKRKGIAFALCPVAVSPNGEVDKKAEENRIDKLCNLIRNLYKSTGETITLLEFNGHSSLGDWQINNVVMMRLHQEVPLVLKEYNPNPFSVLDDLETYKVVVSMRLHGSILGYLANTPVLSINYHEKCKGWCQQVGLKQNYRFNLQELNIQEISWQVEQGLLYGFTPPTLAIDTALKNSLSNWSISHEQAKFYSHYSAI